MLDRAGRKLCCLGDGKIRVCMNSWIEQTKAQGVAALLFQFFIS